LPLPSREAMLQREPSVQQFWDENKILLRDAWKEWEADTQEQLVLPDETLLNADLRHAISQAWEDPTTESLVKKLWQEVAPGVFQCQFFDPQRLADLRDYLDATADAQIPLRPPYGIALNRRGAMLDRRSEGYLAAPGFQQFYQTLVDQYMRPIARLLFPEVQGYDSQTFGFSIQYQAGMDTSLRMHTDASAVTLNVNVNLNLPGETFTGSEVDFYDPISGRMNRLMFKPGTAMIHRGSIAHAAQPITSRERSNLVIWLYGNNRQIPAKGTQPLVTDAQQRWTVPTDQYDEHAPF
jgi:hypothetical protein